MTLVQLASTLKTFPLWLTSKFPHPTITSKQRQDCSRLHRPQRRQKHSPLFLHPKQHNNNDQIFCKRWGICQNLFLAFYFRFGGKAFAWLLLCLCLFSLFFTSFTFSNKPPILYDVNKVMQNQKEKGRHTQNLFTSSNLLMTSMYNLHNSLHTQAFKTSLSQYLTPTI